MGAKLNLIGQRFGRLLVIAEAPNKGNRTQWLCKCDCGQEYIGRTDSLRAGKLTSCGCLRTETARINGKKVMKDLVGQRFGLLTVLSYAGSRRSHSSWKCQCECGNIVEVCSMELIRGDTISCGCLKSSYAERRIEQLLKEQCLYYKREYTFPDLLSENSIPLRFDFAVFDGAELSYLIEYDGEQHYSNKTDDIWKDTLAQRQSRDAKKNEYCLKHNIRLYRVPFYEKHSLTFTSLTDNKYLINRNLDKDQEDL